MQRRNRLLRLPACRKQKGNSDRKADASNPRGSLGMSPSCPIARKHEARHTTDNKRNNRADQDVPGKRNMRNRDRANRNRIGIEPKQKIQRKPANHTHNSSRLRCITSQRAQQKHSEQSPISYRRDRQSNLDNMPFSSRKNAVDSHSEQYERPYHSARTRDHHALSIIRLWLPVH